MSALQSMPADAMPLGGAAPPSEDFDSASKALDAEAQNPYGENNENLPENLQNKLKDLCQKCSDEDKFSRRLEIQTSKRAHWYWRTLQHLVWDSRAEGWVALGPSGAPLMEGSRQSYTSDSAVLYETNIYQPFGLTLIAVLTQNIPAIIAIPADGDDAADMMTAKAANRIRKIIEHENDATMLLTEAVFFAYVDGRTHAWTRSEEDPRTKKERPKITIHGSLEVKVPITAKCQDDFLYIQYSHEVHVAIAKADNPKVRSKIMGGAQGAGQDVYERTARISVAQGTSYMSGSGDTLVNQATEQQTWMRKAAFELLVTDGEKEDDPDVAELKRLFPDGVRVKFFGGGVYCGSWNESMDDHWKVLKAMPGDGQFVNSLGHTTESVQERFNDIINIAQDTYEKTIPASHWDVEMFAQDGVVRQVSSPGKHYPVKKRPQEPIAENVFFEPPSTVSPDMLQYGQLLMGEVPQFLTGAFPALFGGGEAKGAAGDTASGYAMQRDQAMGRIGLVYRAMSRWWAGVIEQAVKCAALLQADMSLTIPDASGNVETTKVRIEELQGDVHWYPEIDESLPASQAQQRAAYMQLLPMADKNPELAKSLMEPGNQEIAQRLLGLEGFELADAKAWEKQRLEINELLKAAPIPNPALDKLKQQLAQMQQESASGKLHPEGAVEQLAMQLKNTPPMLPSVPIDADCDFNGPEWETVQRWMSDSEGIKAKAENPEGFANVRIHGLAHKQADEAEAMKQALMAAGPPKPPQAPPVHGAAPAAKGPAGPNPARPPMAAAA